LSVSFTTLKALDPTLVSQLKDTLPDPLFEKLNGSLSIDQDRLKFAEYKIRVLEERLRLVRIEKYGPGSEKLSDAQLELLELEPGVSSAEVEAESERAQLQLPLKKARKHPGRQELPADLPRIEQLIACTPEQCVCGKCGQETTLIGYETAEQLDVEPAKYFVRVTKREKRACKVCEEQGVQCAPLPPRIIEKGLASDRVVVDTVVSKYGDHLPLYRQSVMLERETGLEISRATLDGWVMRVGELLRPITGAMAQELLAGNYIQADETPVDVQSERTKGKNHQAYLWQYSRPGGAVVFDFRMGREREGPKRFLGNFEGILQSDGYGAYDHVGGTKIVHAACWAHYPEHSFILSSERWRQRTCGQVRRRAPHKNRSQGLQERQEVGLRPPSLGARWLDAGRLPERLHGVALHLQVGRDVSTCCGHAGVAEVVADHRHVGPRLQQRDCAAMPQDMWRDALVPQRGVGTSRRCRMLDQHVCNAVARQRPSLPVDEHALSIGTA
jgi:transposase